MVNNTISTIIGETFWTTAKIIEKTVFHSRKCTTQRGKIFDSSDSLLELWQQMISWNKIIGFNSILEQENTCKGDFTRKLE